MHTMSSPSSLTTVEETKTVNEHPDNSYRTLLGTFKTPLKWSNIISIFLSHILAVYGFATFPYLQCKATFCWNFAAVLCLGGFGVTAGAHRLWTHRSYKATFPLRIILIICYSMAGLNTLREWVRDHRVHHKFSETDADPHNVKRGFFFAHVGWLMMKKHPEVLKKGKTVDCSDLFEDPVVVLFERYFWQMKIFFCFILPTFVPYFLWNETLYWCAMACLMRYIFLVNCTWLVNSAAHMYGNKPYDRKIKPTENSIVAFLTLGEGWHNYHHTFPWDYKAGEFGYMINGTTLALDMFAKIGWAYDLKTASNELIENCVKNHGDGSHCNQKLL